MYCVFPIDCSVRNAFAAGTRHFPKRWSWGCSTTCSTCPASPAWCAASRCRRASSSSCELATSFAARTSRRNWSCNREKTTSSWMKQGDQEMEDADQSDQGPSWHQPREGNSKLHLKSVLSHAGKCGKPSLKKQGWVWESCRCGFKTREPRWRRSRGSRSRTFQTKTRTKMIESLSKSRPLIMDIIPESTRWPASHWILICHFLLMVSHNYFLCNFVILFKWKPFFSIQIAWKWISNANLRGKRDCK